MNHKFTLKIQPFLIPGMIPSNFNWVTPSGDATAARPAKSNVSPSNNLIFKNKKWKAKSA